MKISDKTKKTVLKEFLPLILPGSFSDATLIENIKICRELILAHPECTKAFLTLLINEAMLEMRYPKMTIQYILLMIKLAR